MPRSMFGLTSLWGGLAVLSLCGTTSAQWYSGSGGSNCGCSTPSYMGPPPIMRQVAAAFGAAPMMPNSMAYNDGMQCGQPIACRIDQPVQVVHTQAIAPVQQTVVAVQQLQPVVQPIMQTVQATEMRPVRQTVQRPVVKTEWVDQPVTVMQPVSTIRTANVPTMDYQTVTEYKTVQKQAGYWVTKNIPCNRVTANQYDNRPNAMGAINRASYTMRNAFTPQYQQVRTFVPQTMTCTIPCKKQVAVPGMKQVTYNETKMQAMQTTRKVAVNKVSYETAEVTVMAPHLVTKTVQIGHRVSYAPAGSTAIGSNPASGGVSLAPTADPNNSAAKPNSTRTGNAKDNNLNSDEFNSNKKGASLDSDFGRDQQMTESIVPARKFTAAAKLNLAPTSIRVSQWVARSTPSTPSATPAHSNPQPSGKSTAISVADTTR